REDVEERFAAVVVAAGRGLDVRAAEERRQAVNVARADLRANEPVDRALLCERLLCADEAHARERAAVVVAQIQRRDPAAGDAAAGDKATVAEGAVGAGAEDVPGGGGIADGGRTRGSGPAVGESLCAGVGNESLFMSMTPPLPRSRRARLVVDRKTPLREW